MRDSFTARFGSGKAGILQARPLPLPAGLALAVPAAAGALALGLALPGLLSRPGPAALLQGGLLLVATLGAAVLARRLQLATAPRPSRPPPPAPRPEGPPPLPMELPAALAHELNQPLAGVVFNADAGLRWLRRDQPDLPEALACLEGAAAEGRRAVAIVQRLRGLALRQPPARARTDLNQLAAELPALLQRELAEHGMQLQLDLAPRPLPVLADRVQLQQVLVNLVVNAIQAARAAGDRSIRLTTEAGAEIRLRVEDRGRGLDAAALPKLFSAFYTTRPEGMGLGLAICRAIVEAHDGRIWAAPRPGGGAAFHLALPAAPARP